MTGITRFTLLLHRDIEYLFPDDSLVVSGAAGSIDYLGSRFRSLGINKLELVSQTFVSWNQLRTVRQIA